MESSLLLNYLSLGYGALLQLKALLEEIMFRLFMFGLGISIGLIIVFIAVAIKLDYLLSKVEI